MENNQEYYTVLYTHRFGENQYIVKSDHYPTREEIIKACEIDDLEIGEYLEWEVSRVIQI